MGSAFEVHNILVYVFFIKSVFICENQWQIHFFLNHVPTQNDIELKK